MAGGKVSNSLAVIAARDPRNKFEFRSNFWIELYIVSWMVLWMYTPLSFLLFEPRITWPCQKIFSSLDFMFALFLFSTRYFYLEAASYFVRKCWNYKVLNVSNVNWTLFFTKSNLKIPNRTKYKYYHIIKHTSSLEKSLEK